MNGSDARGKIRRCEAAGTSRLKAILLTGGMLILAGLPAMAQKGFWAPHFESVMTTSVLFQVGGAVDRTDPWAQQLRNLKDVLRVDAFRPKPTPTPAPTPVPTPAPDGTSAWRLSESTLTWIVSPWGYDPNPPHPLTDYLSDVADVYRENFFPHIARELKKGGAIVENLITGRGRHRFRAARSFASRLDVVARKNTNDALVDYYSLNYTDALCDDYRSIARAFAHDLRLAARNAAAGHQLTRGLAYRPERMLLRVKSTHYAFYSPRVEVIQTDGYGNAASAVLSEPDFSSGGGSITIIRGGGGSASSFNTLVSSGTLTVAPTPTPSPAP